MGKLYESIDGLMGTGLETTGKGTKQRASAIDVASRGRETFFGSKKRAIATGVGILGIWSFLGYNKEVVMSPTEAVNAIIDGAQWVISIPDQIWGEDESSSASPNTVVATAPSTTTKFTDSSSVQTSGNPTNLVPVVTVDSTNVPTTVVETTESARTPTHVYSGNAGGGWEIPCYGPPVNVTIAVDGGAPVNQMTEQTGENWNVGQKNSPQDQQAYEIIAQNVVSQNPLVISVYTQCENLEKW